MEVFDIITEASQYSKKTGNLVFFVSGGIACFNFFNPGYIPTGTLNTAFTLLTLSFIGMAILSFKYRKIPHLTNTDCPRCQSRMACIGTKCLDEFKKGCNFSVDLNISSLKNEVPPNK